MASTAQQQLNQLHKIGAGLTLCLTNERQTMWIVCETCVKTVNIFAIQFGDTIGAEIAQIRFQ